MKRNLAAKRREQIVASLYKKTRREMETNRSFFLSLREVCEILDVDLAGVRCPPGMDPDEPFTKICAWDYYFLPGCLYGRISDVAEMSPAEAMDRGARALLTERQEGDYPCVVVPDVTAAYCRLCGVLRGRRLCKTITVTGSVGKTTTKGLLLAACARQYSTFCDQGNFNMTAAVGHFAQFVPADCGCYIQEAHEGDPGSARDISRILQPDIAVVTNIGASHFANFGSYENLVRAVTEITAGMPEDGVVILNGDDGPSLSAAWDRRTIRVSVKDPGADYAAEEIRTTEQGLRFTIRCRKGAFPARLRMFGVHNVTDALLAFAAAVEAGVPPEKALRGMATYRARGVRQNVVRARGRTLYLDCYNAAVQSMESSLETLDSLPLSPGGKRVAVLGDITELGEKTEEMHREVGRLAAASSAEVLICYGTHSASMAEEARAAGQRLVFHTSRIEELNRLVKEQVGPKDAVLFKASHATKITETVRANYPFTYFRTSTMEKLRLHLARAASMKGK